MPAKYLLGTSTISMASWAPWSIHLVGICVVLVTPTLIPLVLERYTTCGCRWCFRSHSSSLKAIPAWNSPLVPIIYILNSLVLGSIITFTIFFYFEIKIKSLSNSIIIISLTTLCLKLLYWKLISKEKNSNISTATGLGTKTKTSFFEGPHTGKNFLTSEMINQIAQSKSFLLRISLCIFIYVTPTYFIWHEPYLVMSRNNITTTLIILSIIASIGMSIERYLFFIEAKHTVTIFYGNKII